MCIIVLLSLPCASHDSRVSTSLVTQEGLVGMAPVFSSSCRSQAGRGDHAVGSPESQAAAQTHPYGSVRHLLDG